MKKVTAIAAMLLAGVIATGGILVSGCSPKPNKQEVSKLDEQKAAAEAAEKKLAELRAERLKLEAELQAKQAQLQKSEKGQQTGKNASDAPAAATPTQVQADTAQKK